MIDYNKAFETAVAAVRAEGRYRVFADIERIRGRFPTALYHPNNGEEAREITVWCSNDYLGMGQNEDVVGAMQAAAAKVGAGAGGSTCATVWPRRLTSSTTGVAGLLFCVIL